MKLNPTEITDTHNIYKILGIKIKIRKKSQPYSIYSAIYKQWRLDGISDELIQDLNKIDKSLYNWKELNNKIWVIYLSCLIKYNPKKAIYILNKYNYFYDKKDIYRCLSVANFAYNNNSINNEIKLSASIYQELEKNRQNKELEKMLKGKSIAIVGNGPSEIGKCKGIEIDKHDIVIRFNNFETNNFEKDYGTRTDIWCCNLNYDIKPRREFFKMVLLPEEIDHKFISKIDLLADAVNKGSIIYNYGAEHLEGLNKDYYDQPTFGLRLIFRLSKILDSFDNVDFYGFNFCKDIQDSYTTHYFKSRNLQYEKLHNLMAETEYLTQFISERKNKNLIKR